MTYEGGAFIFQTYQTTMYTLVGFKIEVDSMILLLHVEYYGHVQDNRLIFM